MAGGRPLKFESPEQIEKAASEYFEMCKKDKLPLTMTGLAIALDTDRQTLVNYGNKEEFFDTIKRIKLVVENFAESCLFDGKNTAGVIFNLKNNYGWVDKQEIDTKVNMSYEEKLKQVADDNEY